MMGGRRSFRMLGRTLIAGWFVAAVWAMPSCADEVDDSLAVIARTGPGGVGAVAARAACDALGKRGAEILPRLLVAMETDNPLAANWYRSAYETIVERELARPNTSIPGDELRAFVRDAKRSGRVRRLALALCDQIDPGFSKQLLPRLLDDPEFREDAVELALAAGARRSNREIRKRPAASFRKPLTTRATPLRQFAPPIGSGGWAKRSTARPTWDSSSIGGWLARSTLRASAVSLADFRPRAAST